MTAEDLLVPAALGAGLLVLLAVTLVLARSARRERARNADALAQARAEAAELRARLDALGRRLDEVPRPAEEFVITDVGSPQPAAAPVPTRIEGRLFADIVLRESLVKAASLGFGVRRALAPATRNRIRFEMKREVKRSRRQRRAELKEIRRTHQARQREQEVA